MRYCDLKNPAFWGFSIRTQERDFCKYVVLAKSTNKKNTLNEGNISTLESWIRGGVGIIRGLDIVIIINRDIGIIGGLDRVEKIV